MSIAATGWRRLVKTGGSKPAQKTRRSIPPSDEASRNMVRNAAETQEDKSHA